MKVVTWNVNSIRQRLPRLLAVLARHDPDVVCLQETKVTDEDFPFDQMQGRRLPRRELRASGRTTGSRS